MALSSSTCVIISLLLTLFPLIIIYAIHKVTYKVNHKIDFFNKCWLISLIVIMIHQTTDITYFDGKISIFIWLVLTGAKCILDEKTKSQENINILNYK